MEVNLLTGVVLPAVIAVGANVVFFVVFWVVKIAKIEERVEHTDRKVDKVDGKVDKLEGKVDRLAVETKKDIESLRKETREEIGKLSVKIDNLTMVITSLVGKVSYIEGVLQGQGIMPRGRNGSFDVSSASMVQDAPTEQEMKRARGGKK